MTVTPPPAYQPAPPPPRRRGLKIYAVLATLLLLGSIGVIIVLFFLIAFMGAAIGAGGGDGPASRVQAETITSGSREKIAVLPISGAIDARMYDRVHNFCEFIKADNAIKAVVIEVDSPGGTVTASDEIYHELSQLKPGRKLVVSMQSLDASGGYYLSMAADKLYAEPTTLTGSIGVIWPSFQVTEMMKKIGVQPEFIKSDNAAEFKDAGSPFKVMSEEDRAYIRGLLNNAQDKFAGIVEAGRKGKLTRPINQIAIGKIWTADDAKTLGIIDDIAYLDEVCANTARDAGISNPTIIRLKNRVGLFELMSATAPIGGTKVELKLDSKDLEQLGTGSMEYRFTGR